jgi:hypothetical protein
MNRSPFLNDYCIIFDACKDISRKECPSGHVGEAGVAQNDYKGFTRNSSNGIIGFDGIGSEGQE